MKNIPGTAQVCAALASAFVAILIVQACAHVTPASQKKYNLVINGGQQLKNPENFCDKLKNNLSSSAIYNFEVVFDNGKSEKCCKPSDCSVSNLTVKVDRVTTFPVAEAPANELTAIGSHVTQRIYSDIAADIGLVAGEFKSEH